MGECWGTVWSKVCGIAEERIVHNRKKERGVLLKVDDQRRKPFSGIDESKVLTTAIGNAELYANATSISKLKQLKSQKSNKNEHERPKLF